jgi:hypothetical protein
MAKTKIVLLLGAFLLATSMGSGLFYRVEVDQTLNHSGFDLNYSDRVEDVQTVSVAVDNIGSVGCEYRLRAVQDGENFSSVEYSRGYPMWPGGTSLMQMKFLAQNYTGPVNTTLFLQYCGKTSKIGNFSYNDTVNTKVNNSIGSETLEATEAEVKLKLPVENGYLVPVNSPPYWRVGSTTINDGKAVASYEPPIFDRDETVEFAVVNESTGNVLGKTTAELDPEKTLVEKIRDSWLRVLLGISVLLNAVLIGKGIERMRK